MHFAYILRSDTDPDQYYIGLAKDVGSRLKDHNAEKSKHTKERLPWEIVSIHGFPNTAKAADFKKCPKSEPGRAFANRHLR